jgi:hypothetical protein
VFVFDSSLDESSELIFISMNWSDLMSMTVYRIESSLSIKIWSYQGVSVILNPNEQSKENSTSRNGRISR